MLDTDVIIGNSTTIITWFITTIATSAGMETLLPSNLSIIIGAILGLIFALLNSYFPNKFKFLGNQTETSTTCNNTNTEVKEDEYC